MDDHNFCRQVLKEVMKDVRKHVPIEQRRKVHTYKFSGFGTGEFHGPNNFYWHGSVCCRWDARSNGWQAYLRHIDVDGYQFESNWHNDCKEK